MARRESDLGSSTAAASDRSQQARGIGAAVAAMGIVFGDIGTSPLYAATTTFAAGGPKASTSFVLGATSTIVWTLGVVVSVLYVRILMRTDNHGEGGLLALFGLIRDARPPRRTLGVLTVLAMVGAAMFVGDSIITPAISVLSAVEGMTSIEAGLHPFVLPVAVAVLVGIFAIQRFGSGSIGRLFGPVMVVWFGALALSGVVAVVRTPVALRALSPTYVVSFVTGRPEVAFVALGGVVLAVTGAEALYADLGHFGRRPITRAWLFLVFPALIVSYLGQGATALRQGRLDLSLFALFPSWALVPSVVLATAATIIASQAVISGTFSVVHQAAGLGLLPPLRLVHTSADNEGQVYIPAVNAAMAVVVVGVAIGFGSSQALAGAYGIAVTTTIALTTTLFLARTRIVEHRLGPRGLVACGALLLVLVIFAGNTTKVASGGWLPLAVGAALLAVMATWWTGRRHLQAARRREEAPITQIATLIDQERETVRRVPGWGVFIGGRLAVVPASMTALVERIHALPEHSVILDWTVSGTPTTSGRPDRVVAQAEPEGVVHVHAEMGFRDRPSIARFVAEAADAAPELFDGFDPDQAVYFVSDPLPRANRSSRMPRWAQRLYILLDRLAPDTVDLVDLPRSRTIVIGREMGL